MFSTLLTSIIALSSAATPIAQARLDVAVEVDGEVSIAQARYYVQRVACAGPRAARKSELTVDRSIADSTSFAVDPGCYEVHFAPLDAHGQRMENCEPGVAIAPVDAEAPTRVVFVTTCSEAPAGLE